MKLLNLTILGLFLYLSATSSKLSIKKSTTNEKKSAITSEKATTSAKSNSKLPDTVAFGYASNENILQNAAVN